MSGPRYLVIDGKRYQWAELLRLRKEQRKAAKTADAADALPSQGRLPAANSEDSERQIRRANTVLTTKPRVHARLFAALFSGLSAAGSSWCPATPTRCSHTNLEL